MDWTYDTSEHALYLRLNNDEVAGQVEMPDGTVVDIDDQGDAVGIEVLRTWADWDLDAVAKRFALDAETVAGILYVAHSPLVRARPLRRATDQTRAVVAESEAESSAQTGPLLRLEPV